MARPLRTQRVPRWAVAISAAFTLAAPFIPAMLTGILRFAGSNQDDSHGLVAVVHLAAALGLMGAWLPLAVSLAVMRMRVTWSPVRTRALWVMAALATAVGTIMAVDALNAKILDAAGWSYLLSSVLCFGAAVLACMMAWRLRPVQGPRHPPA